MLWHATALFSISCAAEIPQISRSSCTMCNRKTCGQMSYPLIFEFMLVYDLLLYIQIGLWFVIVLFSSFLALRQVIFGKLFCQILLKLSLLSGNGKQIYSCVNFKIFNLVRVCVCDVERDTCMLWHCSTHVETKGQVCRFSSLLQLSRGSLDLNSGHWAYVASAFTHWTGPELCNFSVL